MDDNLIKILAIDDNNDNLISVKALINDVIPNAIIDTAFNGLDGIRMAHENKPDVVLLDIIMPTMDGFEVCKHIKNSDDLCDIPVVFLTASRDREMRLKALECGAEGFLNKPIDESELLAQVRAMYKIHLANMQKQSERQRLSQMVEEKTREYKQEQIRRLELFEALKKENEVRKQREKELIDAKEYFELVFNTSPDAASISQLIDGTLINVNEGFINIFGYQKEELVKKRILDLDIYQDKKYRKKIVAKLLSKGYLDELEVELQRKNGEHFIGLLAARLVVLKGVSYISSNIRDITDRKAMEDNFEYLSYHDYLTDLYNRRFFESKLKELDNPKMLPISLIVGDINGVKLINDAFGRINGDKLIFNAAKVIKSCCRENDILARMGGDEFALLMPKTNSVEALEVLKNIQEACAKYNSKIANDAFHISVSLGFSTKTSIDQSFNTIMKIADKYMYQRKLLEHKSMHSTIIASIRATLLEKDEQTEEHCERLIKLSKKIGIILKLSEKEMDELELLATLHDIGKIGIDDRILKKKGKLNEEEWYEMKKHPEIGHRIALSSPELTPIAEYILCHHERWDGNGYPQNLAGEDIPLLSRILAVVDAYDAMTMDRPYRYKMTDDEAIEEIKLNAGTQFDPKIAMIFIDIVAKEKKEII